ncbi:MAG: phosphatidate cytidylyltransferase [Turicibacter sp.]|nr:phosphatidate cytidylyltransferase [Turicibacter sp.]
MKERIITAICLLAVVIPIVFIGGNWFLGLMLIAATVAACEMMVMHDKEEKTHNWIKGMILVHVILIVFIPFGTEAALSGFVFLMIVRHGFKLINTHTTSFYFIVLLYVGLSFRALLEIRNHSLTLFFFLIATVILTDTMAYFTGMFIGKNKLAPKISPKKTIEGAVGGWLSGAMFAFMFGWSQQLFTDMWMLIVLAVGLPVLSQIGDLVASAFKRKYDIKDYGKIFPGHGGVMDRIDSQMLAALLIYVIILIGGVM